MDVIVDIDGTVSDHEHRIGLILNEPKDYEAFYSLAVNDPPIMPVIEIVRSLIDSGHRVIFVTGRPERFRAQTMEWLNKNLASTDWYGPVMRYDDDRRPNAEVKSDILDGLRKGGFDPRLVIEDQSTVIQMWRDRGLVALQAEEL